MLYFVCPNIIFNCSVKILKECIVYFDCMYVIYTYSITLSRIIVYIHIIIVNRKLSAVILSQAPDYWGEVH